MYDVLADDAAEMIMVDDYELTLTKLGAVRFDCAWVIRQGRSEVLAESETKSDDTCKPKAPSDKESFDCLACCKNCIVRRGPGAKDICPFFTSCCESLLWLFFCSWPISCSTSPTCVAALQHTAIAGTPCHDFGLALFLFANDPLLTFPCPSTHQVAILHGSF